MSASLKAKIAEVFEEPGCDKNQGKSEKERKKGCTKQLTPGAAAGGCAFDGAKIALQPIVDVAHLVHGPIACEGNSWDNRHSASSGATIYRTGFTTDINELDVIYGAEKRLFKSIREICEKYDPPAIFVYQTCVTGLIGDDIEAVCKRAAEKFNKLVIPVNAPGFAGPKNLGNKLGAEALLDYGNAWVSHAQAMLSEVFDACDPVHGAALAAFAALGAAQRESFSRGRDLLLASQLDQLFGPDASDPAVSRESFWQDWATEPETCSPADIAEESQPAAGHPHYGEPLLAAAHWQGRLYFGGSETARAGGGYLEGALGAAGRLRSQLLADSMAALRPREAANESDSEGAASVGAPA